MTFSQCGVFGTTKKALAFSPYMGILGRSGS
jgi:hypothetical protein